jgi:hypothetical protein
MNAKRTPPVRHPSDCRQIADPELRRRAYNRAIYIDNRWQDSLGKRISAGVDLSPTDVDDLVKLLGHRCAAKTKEILAARLANVESLPNYGILDRVLLNDEGVSYCAGQDYPSEIAAVRRIIVQGG